MNQILVKPPETIKAKNYTNQVVYEVQIYSQYGKEWVYFKITFDRSQAEDWCHNLKRQGKHTAIYGNGHLVRYNIPIK